MATRLIFGVILLAAVFLRFYHLDQIPPSLNWDEVSIGYNAYSILKTGQDEWGLKFPLNFRAYGDYKLPLYIYTDTIFIDLLGLNVWGVRVPSALAGVGTVIFLYLIIKKLTGDQKLALFGMLLAALTPWLVILSRIGLEANLALFLTTAAFYLFMVGLDKNKYLGAAAFLFGLSFFTYNSSRVIGIPLLLALVLVFYKRLKFNTYTIFSLVIIGLFFAITIPLALSQDSSARYNWTKIVDSGAIQEINQSRGHSTLPESIKPLVFNKITYFIPHAFLNYVSHFSPDFLFFNGGSNYQYSTPGRGLLYPISAIFLLLGLYQIYKQKKPWQWFILGWLLIAPLPAAITRDAPHALRTIFFNVPLMIIAALGLKPLIKLIPPRFNLVALAILLIIFVYFSGDFWIHYSTVYATDYSWSWQYGYDQAINFALSQAQADEKIYFTKKYGEPHEFVLFFTKYDPDKYLNSPNLVRYQRSDWFWVDQFDRYIFVNDWEIKDKLKDTNFGILVTSPGSYPSQAKLLKTIYFKDQTPAFDIVRL